MISFATIIEDLKNNWQKTLPFNNIIIVAFILNIIGIFSVYNATLFLPYSEILVQRQLAWTMVAISIFVIIISFFNKKNIFKVILGLGFFAWLLLWAVLIVGKGFTGQYNIVAWFSFKGFNLQPIELAKPLMAISFAWICVKLRQRFTPLVATIIIELLFLLWISPVLLQPDLGGVLVLAFIFLLCFLKSGCSIRWFSLLSVPFLASSFCFVVAFFPHFRGRLEGFIFRNANIKTTGWHVTQLKNTIANSDLWGSNRMPELWHNAYLPIGYSDSIYATIVETTGIFVGIAIIVVAAYWMLYLLKSTKNKNDFLSTAILACGGYLTCQAFIHISVNLCVIPITGLTLPFISYGGSSLVASWITLALVIIMLQKESKSNHSNALIEK